MESKFTHLDNTEWYDDNMLKQIAVMLYLKDNKVLDKIDEIEENKDEDATKCYLQFEVSFNQDKALTEVHLLIQDYIDGNWNEELNIIGSEIKDANGQIVGHQHLSNEEFDELIKVSRDIFEKAYPKIDWSSLEDY